MIFFSLSLGFVLGVLAVVATEALVLLVVLRRVNRRTRNDSRISQSLVGRDLDLEQSFEFTHNKKGVIWVLESEKVSPKEMAIKAPVEEKSKKKMVEVFPVKKNARIKDHSLVLMGSDGSQSTIQLVGCVIVAVSASSLSSRKWSKRYPIKVENKKSAIYKDSNSFYIYVETSWEKESWCKALRLASCIDKDRLNWYVKLREEFHLYLSSLNEEYPSFMKPSAGFGEQTDRGIRVDGSSSWVRYLKRLAKRAPKGSPDYQTSMISSFSHDERRVSDRFSTNQDKKLSTGLSKIPSQKTVQGSLEEDMVLPFPLTLNHSSSQGQISILSDGDGNEKCGNDGGTLCWNLLISRLFFDAKRSTDLNNFIQARVQRFLSNMRTPSYIGRVTCTRLDLGKLPPCIHSMRVLPMDMKDVWSMEVDLEYSGGLALDVETRIEICEPDFQKGIVNTSTESSAAADATSDLLEGFKFYGDQLKHPRDTAESMVIKDEGDKLDAMRNFKGNGWRSSCASRWKSILNSLSDQVSQVPLSLTIKVTSLRGTLRLHVKPPPSDHLWFGFTCMPDIEWNLESAVGDHKITSSHIGMLISNRFKAAIRETLLLPNCESVSLSWMLAEKYDWVPREVAPFIWVHQESGESTFNTPSPSNLQPGEVKTNANVVKGGKEDEEGEKAKTVAYTQHTPSQQADKSNSFSRSGPMPSICNDQSLHSNAIEDLKVPLLHDDDKQASSDARRSASPEYSARGTTVTGEQQIPTHEHSKPKRIGRRQRMMDLGKKMGEKLEEKRRHMEEKGRHIVDKMRGHDF